MGILHEDQYTFWIISRSVLLRMRNASDKHCRKKNTHTRFMSNNFSFPPKNHAIYETVWRNIVELGRPQMTVWHVRIACWVSKATNTHLGYVILTAFPQKQWLHEGTTVLLL